MDIRADIPEKLDIPDADLCVIISNALNAIEAAAPSATRAVVRFSCHMKNSQLLLEIANPFEGEVKSRTARSPTRTGSARRASR